MHRGDCSPAGDHHRGLPRTYDVNELGQAFSTVPATGWSHGELVRATLPTFRLRPPILEYDPTIIAQPAEWRRPK